MLYRYTAILISICCILFLLSCNRKSLQSNNTSDCIDTSKIKDKDSCNYLYQPVCGCDLTTYRNVCFAEHSGVKTWTSGACADRCIDESVILRDEICTREYKPVCGCNDVTYSNPCVARKQGILRYTLGKCEFSSLK